MNRDFEVDLTPDISSLKMFRSLSFTPWFALGEFIDNSITSALKSRDDLVRHNGRDYKLVIKIDFDKKNDILQISDNAAGIRQSELSSRALRTGIPPEDTSVGLGKHGVGLKAAALWWGDYLEVKTFPLGEDNGWQVRIDISGKEVQKNVSVQAIPSRPFPGTIITIGSLGKKVPQAKTVTAIKAYLRSIYRKYIEKLEDGNQLNCEIYYEDELLVFEEPRILIAPFWPDKHGPGTGLPSQEWREQINIELKSGLMISGWVGILEEMSRDLSGFFLHYRGKGIAGVVPLTTAIDEDLEETRDAVAKAAYKPRMIFKQPGSYPDQSFVGEFDITVFGKSITTDSPLWSPEEENEFVLELNNVLSRDSKNFIKMAQNYRRRRAKSKAFGISEGEERREEELFKLTQEGRISHAEVTESQVDKISDESLSEIESSQNDSEWFELRDLEGHSHHFRIKIIEDISSDFVVVQEGDDLNRHQIIINFAHPMFDDLIMTKDSYKIVRRIAVALASAEVFSVNWDKRVIRVKMNEILSRLGKRADND